ncbi:hypothetical protein HN415_07375 [Candidatus Woesearchaeota archaeon]|jgi:hypothetical protein|nr:hypothetical protein [Candidatus Woesearchaeota archaeon]
MTINRKFDNVQVIKKPSRLKKLESNGDDLLINLSYDNLYSGSSVPDKQYNLSQRVEYQNTDAGNKAFELAVRTKIQQYLNR